MKKDYINFAMAGIIIASLGVGSAVFAEDAQRGITKSQPELAKQDVTIVTKDGKKHIFSVEIAKTLKEQEIGEMFRTNIPNNGGMLFVWPVPQVSNMWMKNTLVPLDMVFIDGQYRIQAIAENTVPYSLAPISSHGPVIATLELKSGTTEKLGIIVGDKVESSVFSMPATVTQNKSSDKQEQSKQSSKK